jgi:hypothetical protein
MKIELILAITHSTDLPLKASESEFSTRYPHHLLLQFPLPVGDATIIPKRQIVELSLINTYR